ncbi:hypothetical protein SAMN05216436_12171 [bacterium A37T11]|nr:hypothetical protein SAMN05216436_12171 [bacterium A37T11]
MKKTLLLIFAFAAMITQQSHSNLREEDPGQLERAYLVKTLTHIADPVLESLSRNELKKRMPVEAKTDDRRNFTYLEAFGRLLAGMAPWLELGPDPSREGQLRQKYITLVRQCIKNATDPKAADYMNFNQGGQALVDAAFLAQGLLRAPTQLWDHLEEQTKNNVLKAFSSTRVITPGYNNWLLFSAEIEAALLKFGGSCDRMRIDYALRSHKNWYKGDAIYGDGPHFHWDYYNSFVIQPMLLDVTNTLAKVQKNAADSVQHSLFLARARRYAEIQERLISPEGTYPPIGRSLAYRFGAFQVLSQMALQKTLPKKVSPQQVRAALYTMIKRQIEAPSTFDKNGWLQIGIFGHQPNVGETYISTGSLYLCSEAFLFLGLPNTDELWQGKDKAWTAKKVWEGEDLQTDHADD